MADHGAGRTHVESPRNAATRGDAQMRGIGSALPLRGAPSPDDAAKSFIPADPGGLELLRLLNRSLKRRRDGRRQ